MRSTSGQSENTGLLIILPMLMSGVTSFGTAIRARVIVAAAVTGGALPDPAPPPRDRERLPRDRERLHGERELLRRRLRLRRLRLLRADLLRRADLLGAARSRVDLRPCEGDPLERLRPLRRPLDSLRRPGELVRLRVERLRRRELAFSSCAGVCTICDGLADSGKFRLTSSTATPRLPLRDVPDLVPSVVDLLNDETTTRYTVPRTGSLRMFSGLVLFSMSDVLNPRLPHTDRGKNSPPSCALRSSTL